MIITEDHILKEELSNLTRILLAHAYPLHLIIKNIKELLTRSRNYLLCQPTPHTETNILSIRAPFSDIGKQLTAIIHRNWHNFANDTTLSSIWSSRPLSAYAKSSSIHNHLVHLFTLQKHATPHGRIPSTTTYANIDIPTMVYTWRYSHSRYTCFLLNTGHNQLILIL